MTELVDSKNYVIFMTNRCICLYDKNTKILKGYKSIINSKLKTRNNSYLSIGDVNSSITSILESDVLQSMSQYGDSNELVEDLKSQVNRDGNPILLIYEFK